MIEVYTASQVAAIAGLTRQQVREAVEAGALRPAPSPTLTGGGKTSRYGRSELVIARVAAALRRHGTAWSTIAAVADWLRPTLVAGQRYRNVADARRAHDIEYVRFDAASWRKHHPEVADASIAESCARRGVARADADSDPTISLDELHRLGQWLTLYDGLIGSGESAVIHVVEDDDAWQAGFGLEPPCRHDRSPSSWTVVDLRVVTEGLR